ncbi:MAG: hypothetical protein EP326_07905 [Deltaproteobacteria bacterium]|nr:MAG: hypothetical protein EP326_07905 [Deltaproteobacteria bacterium]TNF32033.1 MAG: hypothetical protein EP319_00500 [Deltaproteobacteria bacterium]
MKKIILLAALFMTTAAFAEDVRVIKTKCSLFGNLKIKVTGLEAYGKIGEGYLKANVPVFDNCKDTMMVFNQTMGRGMATVDARLKKEIITRRERRDRDNDRHKLDKWEYTCTDYERTTLMVDFPEFPDMPFDRVEERVVRWDYYCR